MSISQGFTETILRSTGALSAALHAGLMDWQVRPASRVSGIENVVRPSAIGGIRMIELSGGPFQAARGRSEIGADGEEFLGVLFQREGLTLCKSGRGRTRVRPGDISVWYSGRPVEFEMPERFSKLCMLIPLERFETVLPNASGYEGLLISSERPLAALLGAYMTTLTKEVRHWNEPCASGTVNVTLELLAAAFRANSAEDERAPREKLNDRIFQYIDSRLGDPNLTPLAIAEANDISLRYLYLVFSMQGLTVAGWIRQRRLTRCRSALDNVQDTKTIAEIAYKWGFSDAAHFSRLFKAAYGSPPSNYRSSHRGDGSANHP